MKGCNNLIYIVKSKSIIRFIIIMILLFLFIPNYLSFADSKQWDSNWSYSQEIKIPFDTSLEISHFQPINIKIDFQNPCWAKNDLEHSIRVCCWDGKNWHELESQIYDLEHTKNNYIESCNLVFLIPDFAIGTEKYFVYYDDSKKTAPNYVDHLKIEESYYKYEPIPGYPLESSYYKILDDNFIPYAVAYKGQIMGYTTCQHITKMKEGTVEMLPKNGELFAAFDFRYTYDKGVFSYSSTSQKLISKKILVDGNLMLGLRIVSTSKLNDLQTTATYKYYHCPTTNTRIHVHVKHETLKEINVCPLPPATNTDGVFTTLQCGGIKSKSIEELNIGEILPFMHFYNEIDTTSEYVLDIDPEYIPVEDPDIRVVSIFDDVDLGKNAWISFDEGQTGISHSVIFNSNDIMISGTDEKDGLQLNAFEMDYPHLPGLENNIATIQVGRNSFETGENHDLIIPEDFLVDFDAEFFSSKTGGFPIIEKEVEIFQELVKIKPESESKFKDDYEEKEKYDLSVYVHLAPSIPMGSTLSALLGFNLSYISIELYKNDGFISSGTAVRLPMKAIEDFGDSNIFEKIIATLKIFDIRNISIFKKAVFPDIEKGKYVIKIFKENAIFSKDKQYIGYAIVDLQKDEKIHILCKSEASMKVNIVDQNNKGVKNAEVVLQKDNVNIAKYITNENGQAILKAPISNKAYDFKVFYNGCIIHQEPVKLGLINKIIPSKKTVNIPLFTLNLKVKDTWGQIPEVELNPVLSIKQNNESIRIYSKKNEVDNYIFTNLASNIYQLSLTYKSFNLKQNIEISEDKELNLKFPAEYNVKLKVMDARGKPYQNSKIIINRNNKKLEIQSKTSETIITIPPAEYQVGVYNNDELIGLRYINVYGEQKYELITKHQPIYPTIVILTSFLLIIFSFILLYYLKNLKKFYIIFVLILVILSLYLPWWEINGSSEEIQTSTSLYLIPNNMITMTSTENTIAGEASYLPIEFQIVINLLIIFTITGCILLILNNLFKNTSKKRLYQISEIFTNLLFVGSLIIFIIALNEITKVTTGSIIGTDYLEFGAPGENQIHSVLSNWNPGIGFYLYLASIVILIITFSIKIFKERKKK